MRLTNIPQLYRNMNRWTEILSVLSRYGLADWIQKFQFDFAKGFLKDKDGEVLAKYTREARIRMALEDLGPTFIKLGQILSTRPDIVGVDLADELKRLQANVPADPPEKVRTLIEEELGQPIDQLFSTFEDKALASASIGQVHLARLFTGEKVVVKVQHHGIEKKVSEDLDILTGLAALAENVPEFRDYHPKATVAEFQRALRRELDFGREERNILQFEATFEHNETVRIPSVYPDLCTPRVLTMEYIEGIKLNEQERLIAEGIDLSEVARRGAELYMHMIFDTGFYHADPHPGNLVLLPGDVIGLLDYGMVGRIDDRLREDIEDLLMGITSRDADLLTATIMRIGSTPPDLDERSLRRDANDFVSDFANQQLDGLNFADAVNEMFKIVRNYRIQLPPQVTMLLKTMMMLDGTGRMLNPQFSLGELFHKHRRRIMMKRFSPSRRLRKLWRMYNELERLAEVMPRRISEILELVRVGKFDIHLDHRRLEPSVNRMVMGIMTAALFIGSSQMLSSDVPPLLFKEEAWLQMQDISIPGAIGLVISFALGFRLVMAINRSGKLDRE
ncbi:ABC1 kinase family protein [Bremerella sp. T1]|uniref:ABC1 kinase family protein n=1 Tax=Bremerella sp. TYQ1 TaxID=3119568 RepID=UPI001CCC9EC3|nr:AarF/ABC1/UbiB kinase family protein [Bremerella volcania]UBM37636.1 AarF/ABC1/UbiB kinase family protein [Bremerella volcania]